jgi:hypothetical protein
LMLSLHCFSFVFMFVMLVFCCSNLLSFLYNCVPLYLCVCSYCLLFILFSSLFTYAHGCLKVLSY